jgi:hypothetical protein
VPKPPGPPTAVATASYDVAPHDVWAFRLDFTNLPHYNPDVSGVTRLVDGSGDGGVLGPGARYTFGLADPRGTGEFHPVELWVEAARQPTLVSAGMRGGNEAYEEFVVRELPSGGCEATLTLWVALPDTLSAAAQAAAAAGSFTQIDREVRLMKEVLEGRAGGLSVH